MLPEALFLEFLEFRKFLRGQLVRVARLLSAMKTSAYLTHLSRTCGMPDSDATHICTAAHKTK